MPRAGSGYMASRDDLQCVSARCSRSRSISSSRTDGKPRDAAAPQVRICSMQLRANEPGRADAAVLAEEDSDTIDLVGMLFDYIGQNLRPNSSRAVTDDAKLQVPVLRSALSDKTSSPSATIRPGSCSTASPRPAQSWMGDEDADRPGRHDDLDGRPGHQRVRWRRHAVRESLLDDLGSHMSAARPARGNRRAASHRRSQGTREARSVARHGATRSRGCSSAASRRRWCAPCSNRHGPMCWR